MATTKTAAKKPSTTYRVVKKRSGRFSIRNLNGTFINGEAKLAILVKEGHLKHASKKKAGEAPAPAAT